MECVSRLRSIAASRVRPILTTALAVLTPVLLLFATLSTWAHFEVLAPDALGENVRRSLNEPAVRDELAGQITARVTASDPRLAAAGPVVQRAAEILITSRPFADIVEIALQQLRRSVTEGRAVSGTRLRDIETQLGQILEVIDPSLAEQLPANWDTSVIDLRENAPVPTALRVAERVGRLWWLWCGLTALTTVGWIASAYNRRRVLSAIGASLAGVAVVLVVARNLVGEALESGFDQPARAALRATYDVFTSGINTIAIAYLAAAAIVLTATLTGAALPRAARRVVDFVDRLTRLPARPAWRIVWAAAAVSIGVGLALGAGAVGPVVAVAAGVVVAFTGVSVLVRTLPSQAPVRRHWSPRTLASLGAVVLLLVVMVVVERTDGRGGRGTTVEADPVLRCNGHVELCDRRLDEVVFAGTHNSMSSADAGFLFGEQTKTIAGQLEGGVRLLMVDTHYGSPTSTGLVLTDLVFNDRAALVRRFGDQTVANIEALRSTVVQVTGPSQVYLCHSFCELGATQATSAFREIRDFLAKNPSEVVVMIIEDSTRAVDTVRSLHASGLASLAYRKEPNTPWPTLGELIRNGTPLVVFSQREGGYPDWFLPAFSHIQDNPFTARSIDELSCAPNRGPLDADLLLMNHWIDKSPPDVADAARINDRDFIVDRARRCAEVRGQMVNFIAVDFWETGGLLAAVDELNLGSPDQ